MLTSSERGFTLIEITIAIVILSVALLGIGATTGQMLKPAADAELEFQALQVVESQLALISLDPRYKQLDSLYEGSTGDLPGLEDSMIRSVRVTRSQTDVLDEDGDVEGVLDRTEIRVAVTGGRLTEPVERVLTLGAP